MLKSEPLMTLLVQWTIYLNAVGGAENLCTAHYEYAS